LRIPKELIVCIVLLAIAILDLNPRKAEYADLRDELSRLKKQYARELLFQGRHEEIEKELDAALQVHADNEKRLYPGNMPSETALNHLQDLIKQTLQSSGLEIVNFKWGEPYKKEKRDFYILPVSFMATGDPAQIEDFFKRILFSEKALNCPLLNIMKGTKGRLTLDATAIGYQLPPEVK
jgi:Tfp pilus assembly protein PilO